MRTSNVIDREATHSLQIQFAHSSSAGYFYVFLVIKKYLNTSSKELLIVTSLCWDFVLQSADEKQIYI